MRSRDGRLRCAGHRCRLRAASHAPDEQPRQRVDDQRNDEQDETDLHERVFNGSAAKLVMQALAASETTPKELEEIQQLIDKHRKGRR